MSSIKPALYFIWGAICATSVWLVRTGWNQSNRAALLIAAIVIFGSSLAILVKMVLWMASRLE